MLGDPVLLKTRASTGWLVGWNNRLRLDSEAKAAAVVTRLLADPDNVASLRAGLHLPDASLEELEHWLIARLCAGSQVLLRTRPQPPTLDEAETVELKDLIAPVGPSPAPPEPSESVAFVELTVVNETGEPLAHGHAELQRPDGERVAFEDISWSPLHRDLDDPPTHIDARLTALRWWGGYEPEPRDDTKDPMIVSFEDLQFNMNSPVVLPSGRIDPQADDPRERITGLDVFRSVLEICSEHDRQVLVVGHTDTTGRREYNDTLSLERAQNVAMILRGTAEPWADANLVKHYKADWKLILRWVHETFGWDCDPGPIDESNSLRSRRAVQAFRDRFDVEHEPLPWPTMHGREDWLAYFRLYSVALAANLDLSVEALDQLRQGLQFAADGTLGYGERWPKEEPGNDEFASAINRRVELWLLEADEASELDALDPDGALLYGPDSPFRPNYIPITKRGAEQGFEVIVVDPDGQPLPGASVRLSQAGAVFLETTTDGIGRVWVQSPRPDAEVEVEVVGHDVFVGIGGVDDDVNVSPETENTDELDGFVC